jgi:hypothetical protein
MLSPEEQQILQNCELDILAANCEEDYRMSLKIGGVCVGATAALHNAGGYLLGKDNFALNILGGVSEGSAVVAGLIATALGINYFLEHSASREIRRQLNQ